MRFQNISNLFMAVIKLTDFVWRRYIAYQHFND